jgi:hypothetical protein
MAMSTVEQDRIERIEPCEWTGRKGTRFFATSTAGKGYNFALVYTVCDDGTRVPFDTVDLHAEESVTGAFDAWRVARTGYAAPVGVAA